jgi:hypothetical protein
MGPSGKAGLAAILLCGGLAVSLPVALGAVTMRHKVTPPDAPPPAESPAPDRPAEGGADGPATIRAALQLMADHFGFTVIGANRLGNDAPSWPAEDLPADAMLHALLRDYSYIVVLKSEAGPNGERDPETVMIVSHNPSPTAAPSPPPAQQNRRMQRPFQSSAIEAPTSVANADAASRPSGHVPSWAPPPSTVVRQLAKLASTTAAGGTQDPNSASADTSAAAPVVPNPAENAAAMAALTRSAQAGLGALVTGLRQACPNPNAC